MKTKFIGLCLISLAALSASAFAQNPSRIANMSARVRSGPGASTSIVGFSVPSGQNKSILARIVGPSLSSFGIQGGLMADPVATLYDRAGRVIVQNDNWETQPGFGGADYRLLIRGVSQITGAFPLLEGGKDAALMTNVSQGNYTVHATAKDSNVANAYGVTLVELYDVTDPVNRQSGAFTNISCRNYVGVGSDVLILGIVIDGQTPVRVLARAVGPSLAQFGVDNPLQDPVLKVVNTQNGQFLNGSGTFVADSTQNTVANDDWQSSSGSSMSQVGAFGLASGSKDAAVVVSLNPGSYTFLVAGKGNATGNALAELYVLP